MKTLRSLFPRLDRWVSFAGPIETREIYELTNKVLEWWVKEPKARITLFLNSGGGEVSLATGFCDLVWELGVRLVTIGYGQLSSSAVLLYLAGERRYALTEDTWFMFHPTTVDPPKKGMDRSELGFEQLGLKLVEKIERRILVEATGMKPKQASRLLSSNRYFDASEAREHGIVHEIRKKGEARETLQHLRLVPSAKGLVRARRR